MVCHKASRGFTPRLLEFGDSLLDRVEIGALQRQVKQVGAVRGDRLLDAGDFVRSAVWQGRP
jgi:hypothetical protein